MTRQLPLFDGYDDNPTSARNATGIRAEDERTHTGTPRARARACPGVPYPYPKNQLPHKNNYRRRRLPLERNCSATRATQQPTPTP